MKKSLKKLNVLLFLLFFLIASTKINAQGISLSIYPPLVETVIKPGKSILIAFTVKNYGDSTFLIPKVNSFEAKGDSGNINLKKTLEGPVRFSLANSEIELEKPFFLETNQTEQILLKIRIPENSEQGDFYYTLLLETVPNLKTNTDISSVTKAQIGANILITIDEDGILDVNPKISLFESISKRKITLFGKTYSLFDINEPIPIILKISNTGKNLFKPRGTIEIQGRLGTKKTLTIVPVNILSNSERIVYASDEAKILPNEYNKKPVSFVLQNLKIGIYHLRTKIQITEDEDSALFANTQLIVFPIKISIFFFALLVGLLILKLFREKLSQA